MLPFHLRAGFVFHEGQKQGMGIYNQFPSSAVTELSPHNENLLLQEGAGPCGEIMAAWERSSGDPCGSLLKCYNLN